MGGNPVYLWSWCPIEGLQLDWQADLFHFSFVAQEIPTKLTADAWSNSERR